MDLETFSGTKLLCSKVFFSDRCWGERLLTPFRSTIQRLSWYAVIFEGHFQNIYMLYFILRISQFYGYRIDSFARYSPVFLSLP